MHGIKVPEVSESEEIPELDEDQEKAMDKAIEAAKLRKMKEFQARAKRG